MLKYVKRKQDLLQAQAGFSRLDDGLGSIHDLQLAEDVGDLIAHRFLADGQPLGNFRVGQVLGHEGQDFALAVG